MIITFKDSWKIRTTGEWIAKFDKSKNSEDGKSAKSLAEFCQRKDAEQILRDILQPVLGSDLVFDVVTPEYQTKFDNYGKGRMHDLAIKGKNSKTSFFVGVEAKVNEAFGTKLCSAYKNSLKRESTNFPARIEELLANYFPQITLDSDLPYQLFYSTVSCIKDAEQSILLIMVFETKETNEKSVEKNKKALESFLNSCHATLVSTINGNEYYELYIGNKKLNVIYSKIKQ